MRKVLLFSIFGCSVSVSMSQSVSSPYSLVGLGDVEQRNVSKYAGMASVSIAQRSGNYINTFNPASLTALPKHFVLFEVAGKGRYSSFNAPGVDTATGTSKDFTFKRLSFAYKVSEKSAISFGLQPYSSVNYNFYSVKQIGTQTDAYLRSVEGSGGLNQAYISAATQLGKRFSVGVTMNYLFGSLNQKINYYNPSLAMDVTKEYNTYLRNFNFLGGIQYESKPGKKVQHRLGATLGTPVNLLTENSYKILEGSTDVTAEIITSNTFYKIPLKAAFGYSATFNNAFTIAADYSFQNWKSQTVAIDKTVLGPSQRIALGVEYANMKTMNGFQYEQYFLQGGLFYENTYWKVAGKPVTDIGGTFGAGINFGRFNLYGAYEMGKRGSTDSKQIAEKYSQFTLGLTLKDIWQKTKYHYD